MVDFNLLLKKQDKKKQAQGRAAAETVARQPIEHFIHSINN